MNTKITKALIFLTIFSVLSFSLKRKSKNSKLVGIWIEETSGNPQVSNVKVFESSGNYYNLSFNGSTGRVTLKGRYRVISDKLYIEKVDELQFNNKYDLLNREFTNSYELSENKKRLALRGTVISKNGLDTLRWSAVYKKVEVPR